MERIEEIEERLNDALDKNMPQAARNTRTDKLLREDIPFLITEIARLTTANAELKTTYKNLWDSHIETGKKLAKAEGIISRGLKIYKESGPYDAMQAIKQAAERKEKV
jgi:hypothetical protein